MTELDKAINSLNIKLVKELIAAKVDLNATDEKGATPLLLSIYLGAEKICRLLIDEGADVNIKNSGGYSPLHIAASSGYAAICKLLIKAGADVNARDKNDRTPLFLNTSESHVDKDICKLLAYTNQIRKND
jgi:ankyrin repeat protein